MKLLAAYSLLVLGGNAAPSAEDVTTLITSVGGEVDEAVLATLLTDLEGKDLNELLAAGLEKITKLSASSGGGGGGGGSAPAAGGAAPTQAAAAPEAPKEEEVDALDGGMDMFGGGGGGDKGDY